MGRAATSSIQTPLVVRAQFGVERAMVQAQRAHRPLDRCAHALLRRGALARRRHVNGLFEERPFQRIGLIEYREDARARRG